jgi:hypothetical protein
VSLTSRVGRVRRAVVMATFGLLITGAAAAAGSAARGAPSGPEAAAKAPLGTSGQFNAVAGVPHSSDVWATGYVGVPPHDHVYVAHRHDGHWARVRLPNLGGHFGYLDAVTATSPKSVWIAGARQRGQRDFPAIWRWAGGRFVSVKLPKLKGGGISQNVLSISAGSATSAWAVGPLSLADGKGHVALHWNGKKWSAAAVPEGFDDVSASSASNAWAVGDGGDLFRWNGTVWTKADPGAALEDNFVFGIATSSPTLAYAVGYNTGDGGGGQVMRFNGTSWSAAPLARDVRHLTLSGVAIRGHSAWAYGTGDAKEVVVHSVGGVWSIQQSLNRHYLLAAISASSPTRADIAGSYSVGASTRTLLDVYNGHSWKAAPSKF